MRLTVGPLPAAVYWRRRVIVLGAALLAVFLVAQAWMAAASGGDAAGDPSAGAGSATSAAPGDSSWSLSPLLPSGSVDTEPSEEPDDPDGPSGAGTSGDTVDANGQPPEGDRCTDDDLLITAEASETAFAAGDSVELRIVIANDADTACVRDIGGAQRELYLVHGTGASRVWSSQDCDGPSGSDERQLEPTFESMHYLVWTGNSSSSCDGDEPAGGLVEAGDYQLFAMLGTARSEPVQLTIG